MDDPEDKLNTLGKLYPLLLYFQCKLEVLEATFAVLHKDTMVGEKNMADFLKDTLRKRLHFQLSTLSDSDPSLATAFSDILKEAGVEF